MSASRPSCASLVSRSRRPWRVFLSYPPAVAYVLAKTHTDKLSHLTDPNTMRLTLCGKEVRRTVKKSQADRCPDCLRASGT
jgi:hypothetical protein